MSLQTVQWIIIRFCDLYQHFCKLLPLVCDPIYTAADFSVLRSIHEMHYVKTQLLCYDSVRDLFMCHCGTLVSLQVARCCCCDSAIQVLLWNSCLSAGRRLSSSPGVVVVRVLSRCHCGTLVSLQVARCCRRDRAVQVSLWNSCLSAGRQVSSS